MQIKWEIEKKRGNLRPSLKYYLELEDFEKDIAVQVITIESDIPVIPDDYQNYCLPGTNERKDNWEPSKKHLISTPFFKGDSVSEFIRLPFRENNLYPEVKESFQRLRDEFEKELKDTYNSKPIKEEHSLEISKETKKEVASGVAAAKMLKFAGIS